MTDEITPVCFQCIHFNLFEKRVCKAFPWGIPDKIFIKGGKHSGPVTGQTGEYTFKQKPTIIDGDITVMDLYRSSCMKCIHFNRELCLCPAFPYKIPYDILKGNDKHLVPLRGQKNRLVFTPK